LDKRERIRKQKLINTIGCPNTLTFIAFVVFVAFVVFLALKYPIAIVNFSQSSAQMAAGCPCQLEGSSQTISFPSNTGPSWHTFA
jgi:hypothetical protein